jgi:branched-chain amino acid aminotransferase
MYLLNGKWVEADQPLIMPDNRAFRYGEGLFETMRMQNGNVPLFDWHWQRMTGDLPYLYFELPVHFTADYLKTQIQKIGQKNKLHQAARIRLTLFKGEGGIWEEPTTSFNWLLQAWPLPHPSPILNVNGLDIGVYEGGKKSCDRLANIKSNNYLLYALAAQYAKKNHWNEAIVLNQYGRICDTTIANLFFIKGNRIFTPALSEGCVNGVMRKYLLEQFERHHIDFEEGAYEVADLLEADELFLTNAIQKIRWVKSFGDKSFSNSQTLKLFQEYIQGFI